MLRKLLVATAAAAPLFACAGAALAEVEVTSSSRTTPISTSSPNGGAADDVKVTVDGVITLSASVSGEAGSACAVLDWAGALDSIVNTGSIAAYVVATDDDYDLDDDTDEVGSQQINVTMSRLRTKLSHVEGGRELIRTVRYEGYLLAATVERVSAD